jgi:hypothetical protein
MTVSFNDDMTARFFLSKATGIDYSEAFFDLIASVYDDYGRIRAVFAVEFFNGFDAHINVAVDDPRFAKKNALKAIFTGIFSRATRVTALIDPRNKRAIKAAAAIGFRREGTLRRGLDGKRDAAVMGLLEEDCRLFHVKHKEHVDGISA